MDRLVFLLMLCVPGVAAAQFFTLDQMTGQTGGEISFTYLTFEVEDELTSQMLRGFVEFAPPKRASGGWFGAYLAASSASASDPLLDGSTSIDGVLGIEVGGTWTTPTSKTSAVTVRLGLTVPREGDFEALAVAGLVSPARLNDLVLNFPETGALRLGVSAHGQSGQVYYRLDAGLDAGLFGDLGDELDPILRLNGGVGVIAGPALVGAELVNLINPQESGDDGMLHTATVGIRGDFDAIQPGVGLTFPLDETFSDVFGTVLQISVRGVLP